MHPGLPGVQPYAKPPGWSFPWLKLRWLKIEVSVGGSWHNWDAAPERQPRLAKPHYWNLQDFSAPHPKEEVRRISGPQKWLFQQMHMESRQKLAQQTPLCGLHHHVMVSKNFLSSLLLLFSILLYFMCLFDLFVTLHMLSLLQHVLL